MSREWQQTKLKNYVMPDAVYYQSVWAVRDLNRMENQLAELELQESSRVCEPGGGIMADENGFHHPLEKDILERRIGEIHAALESVPQEYRFYLLQNIILRNPGKGYPEEWRFWKQKFLFNVAKNLSML